jgi:transcriptional regulator with XRE-family HTH domain
MVLSRRPRLSLAERIKSLRRAKNWSQEQFADRASIQRSYLADLERGYRNPSVRTLVKVANALGVGVPALLEDEVKGKRPNRA